MGQGSVVFLLIRTMMFLSANPDAPTLRSLPFLWMRNGAVVFLLAIAALVVLPPNPALAFWSVAAPGWQRYIDDMAKHVEWYLADESNGYSLSFFDSASSEMRYDKLSRESEISLDMFERNVVATYDANPDLFNEPLRGSDIFQGRPGIHQTTAAKLDAVLAKSGSYEGAAYRVQETNPEYIEGLEIDDLYTDTAFSSSSINFKAVLNTADMNQGFESKVILKRILKTGKVVSTNYGGPTRGSRLASRPNTVFKVRGIAKVRSQYGEVTVVLEEEMEEGQGTGLLKNDDPFLQANVKTYSGGKYMTSRGGRQARDAYESNYNEDGTSKVRTGGCPTS